MILPEGFKEFDFILQNVESRHFNNLLVFPKKQCLFHK